MAPENNSILSPLKIVPLEDMPLSPDSATYQRESDMRAASDASALLAPAESAVSEARAGVLAEIAECIDSACATVEDCASCIAGHIGVTLDAAGETAEKMRDKVTHAVIAAMSRAYGYASMVGVRVPTVEEIITRALGPGAVGVTGAETMAGARDPLAQSPHIGRESAGDIYSHTVTDPSQPDVQYDIYTAPPQENPVGIAPAVALTDQDTIRRTWGVDIDSWLTHIPGDVGDCATIRGYGVSVVGLPMLYPLHASTLAAPGGAYWGATADGPWHFLLSGNPHSPGQAHIILDLGEPAPPPGQIIHINDGAPNTDNLPALPNGATPVAQLPVHLMTMDGVPAVGTAVIHYVYMHRDGRILAQPIACPDQPAPVDQVLHDVVDAPGDVPPQPPPDLPPPDDCIIPVQPPCDRVPRDARKQQKFDASAWSLDLQLPKWDQIDWCALAQEISTSMAQYGEQPCSRFFGLRDAAGKSQLPRWLVAIAGLPSQVIGILIEDLSALSMVFAPVAAAKTVYDAIRSILSLGSANVDPEQLPGNNSNIKRNNLLVDAYKSPLNAAFAPPDGDARKWRESITYGIAQGLALIVTPLCDGVDTMMLAGKTAGLCHDPAAVGLIFIGALLDIVERWAGCDIRELRRPIDIARSYLCPQSLPSQADVDAAYLSGLITMDTWRCWTRANDNYPGPAELVLNTKRSRINDQGVVDLRMRKIISQQQFLERMRELGYLSENEANENLQLRMQIPGMSDIVRMMQRDVEDEKIVVDSRLDAEFSDKYKGTLKLWAEQQGVSDTVAKYYWRSHWEYPSPTQAYEMLRRLRPEKNLGNNITTTPEMVLGLLGIADYAPGWRDRLMAVSYLPINRTDLMQAHRAGTIPDAALPGMLQDVGYTLEDSRKLADYIIVRSKRMQLTEAGATTPKQAADAYASGAMTRDDARGVMRAWAINPRNIEPSLDLALQRQTIKLKKMQINSIRSKYMYGEIGAVEAATEMAVIGVDAAVAQTSIDGWRAQLGTRSKKVMAGRLLRWVRQRIIGLRECYERLLRIGHSTIDAEKIVTEFVATIADEEYRKALAAEKEAIKKAAALAAAAEKELRKWRSGRGSRADIRRWLRAGIITSDQALARLIEIGVPPDTAALDVTEASGGGS